MAQLLTSNNPRIGSARRAAIRPGVMSRACRPRGPSDGLPQSAKASAEHRGDETHDTHDNNELLTVLVPRLIGRDPALLSTFLFAGNRFLHDVALQAAYGDLEVRVDVPGYQCILGSPAAKAEGKVETLRKSPRLGQLVRVLSVRHPPLSALEPSPTASCDDERTLAWNRAAEIIELCPRVESIKWETGIGVGGRLWRAISSLKSLKRLQLVVPPQGSLLADTGSNLPRITPQPQMILPPGLERLLQNEIDSDELCDEDVQLPAAERPRIIGQGGRGLGFGWERLQAVHLDNLSHSGAKSLTAHFTMLSEYQHQLGELSISTQFLDGPLMTSIAKMGQSGQLRHLQLATTGTKLTQDGLKEVIEGSSGLEMLILDDIEGRLDKMTWSNISWPPSMLGIEIRIAECGDHHSWVLHHLQSINHLPFDQMTTLFIRRVQDPIALLPVPPPGGTIPAIEKGRELEPLPSPLHQTLVEQGCKLETVCLDWWTVDQPELEQLVKALPRLKHLSVSIRFAFAKIASMGPTFSAANQLESLAVISTPEYNLPTGAAKVTVSMDELSDLPMSIAEYLKGGDATLPDIRDFRKFARRLPRLQKVSWTGRGGKGVWRFSKKSTLVTVTFTHAAIEMIDLWHDLQRAKPSFAFEHDGPPVTVLEVPVSTETKPLGFADFPALTRTTTGSTNRTIVQTPASVSPLLEVRPTARRQSLPAQIAKALSLSVKASPDKVSRRASKPKELDLTSLQRSSRPLTSPKSAPSFMSLGSPFTPTGHQFDPVPELPLGSNRSRKTQTTQASVLQNTARHVPGSGRESAGVVEVVKSPKIVKAAEKKQPNVERIDGWQTVSHAKKPVVKETKVDASKAKDTRTKGRREKKK